MLDDKGLQVFRSGRCARIGRCTIIIGEIHDPISSSDNERAAKCVIVIGEIHDPLGGSEVNHCVSLMMGSHKDCAAGILERQRGLCWHSLTFDDVVKIIRHCDVDISLTAFEVVGQRSEADW